MQASIHIQLPGRPIQIVPIGLTATIGRTRENTICLTGCPLASRQHAILRCSNGWQYQIIDLGSRNGTLVNGQRVVMPRALDPGDEIRIAEATLKLVQEEENQCAEHENVTIGDSGARSELEAEAALLVCDIRGFSTRSERFAAADIAQLLGVWFREAGNAIHRNGGAIDKFIGDAIFAFWSSEDLRSDCARAAQTAAELMELTAARSWPDGGRFEVVCALHAGKAVCSSAGMSAARDSTIIGDAVNTVFRLEASAKEIGQAVIASEDFVQHLPADFARLVDCGERCLKGKAHLVRVFGMNFSTQAPEG